MLVWLFAYVQYAGFNVFNSIIGADAMSKTAHGSVQLWVVIVTVVAFVIALIGYDLIHRAEQVLTYAMLGDLRHLHDRAVLPELPGRHV